MNIEITQNPFKLQRDFSSEDPILNNFFVFSVNENASNTFLILFSSFYVFKEVKILPIIDNEMTIPNTNITIQNDVE